MKNNVYNKSVIATATNTSKSENQDSKGEFEGTELNAIFIADGLGSYKYPRFASERVVDFFKANAQALNYLPGNGHNPKLNEVFKLAKEKLIAFASENFKEEDKEDENLYGTTAITMFENNEKISVAYVGNGAVWHIRGNFNDFPDSYHYPWNAVNYLNPHTIPEKGKEALYRLISNNSDPAECVPTSFELEKDKEVGEIIMICTDGIYSADQAKAGKNDKGVWVRYEPAMLKFFDCLKNFFKNEGSYSKENIERMLDEYLEELKPTLDDDATIGILITEEALNYQNKLNWLNKNENNTNNQV
jgi:serine/threonine protein phosphatase PrpC